MQTRLIKIIPAVFILCGFSASAKAQTPGDLDLAFNSTGKVLSDVGTGNDVGRGVAIQADGKIVVVGSALFGTNSDIAVLRYNTDGSLDATFDGDGKVTTALFTRNDQGTAVAIQPDGKILVVARYQFSNSNLDYLGALIRYNTNGSLDTTFDGDGFAQVLMEDANFLVIQPDGKILVGGSQRTGLDRGQARAQRFNANGSKDASFGNGIAGPGTLGINFRSSTNDFAQSAALQADGKIILAGGSTSGSSIYALARLTPNGQFDTTFDTDGIVTTPGLGAITKVLLQPDGKIVAVGTLNEDFNVTRYNPDGSLDTTFNGDGRATTPFLGSDGALSAVLLPDGKIVAAGFKGGVDTDFALARYNTNGSLDTAFSGDGKTTIDFGSTSEVGYGLALDSSGRLVVAGVSNNLFAVARVLQETIPATLGNISTRLRVETGDNVLFGGFIVTGTQPKRLIVRAIGPTLTAFGVPGALQNPTLELYSGQTLVASNDNWVDTANKQEIIDSTLAPKSDFESAILTSLAPGPYTAIVRGLNGTTGVGLVEVYDLGQTADSKLAQISTRGFVQTGDNVMFGGFFVLSGSQKVIIRAIGPSLPVNGKLADPTMELRDGNGALLEANDNWVNSPNKQAIIDSTVPPTNNFESAILRTLTPGPYTAIVRGVNNTTGISLVEVYALK